MSLLLTRPFTTDPLPRDDAGRWAILRERVMREIAWRRAVGFDFDVMPAPLAFDIPAKDAGDVCHSCGKIVTWTDHLPPLHAGGTPRCFAGNGSAHLFWRGTDPEPLAVVDGVGNVVRLLPPGQKREGAAIVYSAEYLSSPEPGA